MSNFCNSLNIKTLKISQLREYNTVNSDDIFLVIESGDSALYSRRTTFGKIVDSLKYIPASYVGSFTGSLSGSAFGKLSGSFSGSAYGNFNGSFTGSIIAHNIKGSGSLYFTSNQKITGSFYGVDNITNFRGSGVNVSFNGTSSYSVSSSFAKFATTAQSLTTAGGGAVGTLNEYAYWDSGTEIKSTNYLIRLVNRTNYTTATPSDLSPAYFGIGRNGISKPLQFYYSTNQYLLGEDLIFQSASNQSIYGLGMQENTLYLRADANFVMYTSGSHGLNTQIGGGDVKDRNLNPGLSGYTSFVSTKRLIGIGDFRRTDKVDAQCHVHIDKRHGYRTGYVPTTHAFLVTSGSNFDKKLKLDGDGNLDVAGDIIALSTFGTSDARLKKDVHPINNSVQLIEQLNPVQFTWISNDKNDYGLIAQEVEQNYPELIKEDMNGYKTIKYNSFIPILIKSIQDLKEEVNQLKQKIKELGK